MLSSSMTIAHKNLCNTLRNNPTNKSFESFSIILSNALPSFAQQTFGMGKGGLIPFPLHYLNEARIQMFICTLKLMKYYGL